MKAPISVCMIVRNEQEHLNACVASFRDYVEELVIVDTGSTDGTITIARQLADKFIFYDGCNNRTTGLIESFSEPRNLSFHLATQPYKMWIDADDVMVGAEHLVSLINRVEGKRVTQNLFGKEQLPPVMIHLPYEYAYDSKGDCITLQDRERIVVDKGASIASLSNPVPSYKWVNRCHEILMPLDGVAPIYDRADEVKIVHKRQYLNKENEPGRNLRLMQLQYAEEKKKGLVDPRTLYYLGQTYREGRFFKQAVEMFEQYVKVSGWEDEIILAHIAAAESLELEHLYDEMIAWGLRSLAFAEQEFEPYYTVMRGMYWKAMRSNTPRDWKKAKFWADRALENHPMSTPLPSNPRAYKDIELFVKIINSKLSIQESLVYKPLAAE